MSDDRRMPKRLLSSRELLRTISEAHEIYRRRYADLVGDDARDEDDLAASWLALLRGPEAQLQRD